MAAKRPPVPVAGGDTLSLVPCQHRAALPGGARFLCGAAAVSKETAEKQLPPATLPAPLAKSFACFGAAAPARGRLPSPCLRGAAGLAAVCGAAQGMP